MATEAGSAAAGERYTAAFEAVVAGGGAPAAAQAAALLAAMGIAGVPLAPAENTDIWEETPTFKPLTIGSLAAALVPTALSVASNVISVDGSTFLYGTATIIGAGTIGSPVGLTAVRRQIMVTASGAARACAPHGDYRSLNFGAGVTISQDKTGLFEVWNDGTDDWCRFICLED